MRCARRYCKSTPDLVCFKHFIFKSCKTNFFMLHTLHLRQKYFLANSFWCQHSAFKRDHNQSSTSPLLLHRSSNHLWLQMKHLYSEHQNFLVSANITFDLRVKKFVCMFCIHLVECLHISICSLLCVVWVANIQVVCIAIVLNGDTKCCHIGVTLSLCHKIDLLQKPLSTCAIQCTMSKHTYLLPIHSQNVHNCIYVPPSFITILKQQNAYIVWWWCCKVVKLMCMLFRSTLINMCSQCFW